jgi:hypothetical protein
MASNQAIIEQNYTNINTTGSCVYTLSTNNSNNGLITTNYDQKTLKVYGNAEFEGDITIKGKNLIEHLEKIDERLCILHPNTQLEEKWIELKKLRNQYMELEKEILEKERLWALLK